MKFPVGFWSRWPRSDRPGSAPSGSVMLDSSLHLSKLWFLHLQSGAVMKSKWTVVSWKELACVCVCVCKGLTLKAAEFIQWTFLFFKKSNFIYCTAPGHSCGAGSLIIMWHAGSFSCGMWDLVLWNQIQAPCTGSMVFGPPGLQHARLPCPSLHQSLFKFMPIESGMPSNHLVLCFPLLLLPSIFSSMGRMES